MPLQIGYVGSNVPRDNHYEIWNGQPVRCFLVEPGVDSPLYSNDFSESVYTKTNCTVQLADSVIDPFGEENTWLLLETNDTGQHGISRTSSSGTQNDGGFSIFVKKYTRPFVRIQTRGTVTVTVTFNLDTQEYVEDHDGPASSRRLNDFYFKEYANGWFRLMANWRVPQFGAQIWEVFTSEDGTTFSYAGNDAEGIYLFGYQDDNARASGASPVANGITNTGPYSYHPVGDDYNYRRDEYVRWPISVPPQNLSLYFRGWVRGRHITSAATHRPAIGLSNQTFHFGFTDTERRIYGQYADTSRIVSAPDVWVPGVHLEVICQWSETRQFKLIYCKDNGEVVESEWSEPTVGGTFPTTWAYPEIQIRRNWTGDSLFDTYIGFAFANLLLAKGHHGLTKMRSLARVSL